MTYQLCQLVSSRALALLLRPHCLALLLSSSMLWACADDREPTPKTIAHEEPPGIDYPCSPVVEVVFQRVSPWPVARYYLRVRRDGGDALTCAVEFDPVVGSASDTCNDSGATLSVDYAYDANRRELTKLQVLGAEESVDVELFLTEAGPRLAELHHEVTSECLQSLPLEVAEQNPDTEPL
jgi:hypothetical protein